MLTEEKEMTDLKPSEALRAGSVGIAQSTDVLGFIDMDGVEKACAIGAVLIGADLAEFNHEGDASILSTDAPFEEVLAAEWPDVDDTVWDKLCEMNDSGESSFDELAAWLENQNL